MEKVYCPETFMFNCKTNYIMYCKKVGTANWKSVNSFLNGEPMFNGELVWP